ncbi:MAG: hypothetical protein ABEH80_03995 [Halobaculum sp.]
MSRRGGSGFDPVAAFACLGNETRLSILEALYETTRSYDGPGRRAVPYSDLQTAVGIDDSGQFNYHLTRLRNHFVSKTDGGYVLDQTGKTVAQILLRSFGVEDPAFDATPVDDAPVDTDCPRCGESLAVSYADEHVVTRCQHCPGVVDAAALPDGTVSALVFPPAGVHDRSRSELVAAVHRRYEFHCVSMAQGLCPTCGGEVARELVSCSDHDTDGICEACGTTLPVTVSLCCRVCGHQRLAPVPFTRTDSPLVAAAFTDPDNGWERFAATLGWPVESVPVDDGGECRVRVEPPETDAVLWFDEQLRVWPEESSDGRGYSPDGRGTSAGRRENSPDGHSSSTDDRADGDDSVPGRPSPPPDGDSS